MNLADFPTPVAPRPAAFEAAVRQGVGRWVVALVERIIRREEAAVSINGLASTPMLAQLLQRRRVELVQALMAALTVQFEGRTSAASVSSRTADASTGLALISETQIDDEIETARIVQLIESEAELELHEVASLCSRVYGRQRVDLACVPLGPLPCARALREAADEVAPDAALRAALLRGLGTAMATQMREAYAELAIWLEEHGVNPLGYRIARDQESAPASATARVAQLAAERLAGDEAPASPAESMRELVAWAQRTQAPPPKEAAGAELTLRLDARPDPAPGAPLLPKAAAEELMRRLFAELRRQTAQSPSMVGLLQRLEQLAQRLAADDPQIWNDPAHPWWQLLDRLLAAAAVHDDMSPQD
ncbi:MAG: DUF1631 family protein, partial [Betaproteobacteria bacterium]